MSLSVPDKRTGAWTPNSSLYGEEAFHPAAMFRALVEVVCCATGANAAALAIREAKRASFMVTVFGVVLGVCATDRDANLNFANPSKIAMQRRRDSTEFKQYF
jgi:hypothetical protein